MSDLLFPSNLPGLSWGKVRTDTFKTNVYEALSGAERRIRYRQIPKRRIDLSYEVLRQNGSFNELQTLQSFCLDRYGSFESFLFYDPYDYQVTDVQIGVGDGTTTIFQLYRMYAGRMEMINNPVNTTVDSLSMFAPVNPVFWLQDTGVYWPATYTLLPNGQVQFTVAPPLGTIIKWTGGFYYRARFADDTFSTTEFMHRLFSNKVSLVMSPRNIL